MGIKYLNAEYVFVFGIFGTKIIKIDGTDEKS
jgi:hypothetical protein